MPFRTYLSCLWPGLPELWYHGQPRGVVAASVFAVLLNTLLVVRFIYPEWLAPLAVRAGGWLVVLLWLALVVRAMRGLPDLLTPRAVAAAPDRIAEAQTHVLRGRWFEAEAAIEACLAIDPRDPPALLLLATAYRKTGRAPAASAVLDQLTTLEAADRWRLEILAERQRIERESDAEAAIDDRAAEDASCAADEPPSESR